MITFVSLFLGLILGEQPIELAVAKGVASVELRLDGEALATLRGEPWSIQHDFGQELLPHELVAIARDADGKELERSRQWINMPRPTAEAGMVLEQDPSSGHSHARLTWESLLGTDPIEVTATLDGKPLDCSDPRSIPLPAYDPGELHFFRAELRFSEEINSVVEATFGGTFADTVQSQLTAVPIWFEGKKPPTAEQLNGLLKIHGEPAEVVAVEMDQAEVVFLVDVDAIAELQGIFRQTRSLTNRRWRSPLRKDQQMRIIRTFQPKELVGEGQFDLFPSSEAISAKDGGVLFLLLARLFYNEGPITQRLADVVAAAGTSTASNRTRRHVILLAASGTRDESVISPSNARGYLEALNVPFAVWAVEGKPPAPELGWGEVVDASNMPRFEKAVRLLSKRLDQQAVVWIAGKHLPTSIRLEGAPAGIELAR